MYTPPQDPDALGFEPDPTDAQRGPDGAERGDQTADGIVEEHREDDGDGGAGDGDDVYAQLDRAQAEHAELKDKYLRLMAEFDNFRKRTARQRNEERATAAIGSVNALLPVVDDFDRAKQNAESDATVEQFSEGVELVYQKLKRALGGLGLRQMTSTGEAFDPELHEAFTEIPAPSPELVGKVVDTIEPGYFLNVKLIRHAKVVVGK